MRFNLGHALALTLVSVGATPPTRLADGYVVSERITTDAESAPLTLHIKVAQGRVRVDLLPSPSRSAAVAGTYMVLRQDGKVALVDPVNKRAVVMEPAAMAAGAQAAAAMATTEVSNVIVDVTDAGAGEAILGHATHKYHTRQRYVATVSMGGQSRSSTHDVTSDLWIATDVPGYTEGLDTFVSTLGGAFTGIFGGTAPKLAASLKGKIPANGFAMKSVVSALNTDEFGQARTIKTTVDVLDIAKSAMLPAEFDIPAGYQVMDMAGMRGRGGR